MAVQAEYCVSRCLLSAQVLSYPLQSHEQGRFLLPERHLQRCQGVVGPADAAVFEARSVWRPDAGRPDRFTPDHWFGSVSCRVCMYVLKYAWYNATLSGVMRCNYDSPLVLTLERSLGAFILSRFQFLLLLLCGLLRSVYLRDFVSFVVESQTVASDLVGALASESRG